MTTRTNISARRTRFLSLALAVGCVAVSMTASPALAGFTNFGDGSDFTFFPTPTAWDPGPNTARIGGFPAPGGATWSLMSAGIGIGVVDTSHLLPSGSMDLMAPAGTVLEEAQIDAALDTWAIVSLFTNLGKVADGGVVPGAAETVAAASGGDDGDIRVGAYDFPAPAPGFTLAHAFQPVTEAIGGPGGAIGGDTHFNTMVNSPGFTWVDDPGGINAAGTIDFFTVALHEFGHALGLGHSAVVGSVMEPIYAGTRRTLVLDDIAGIQAIYGIPEPSSIVLAAVGGLFFVMLSYRRKQLPAR